MPLDTLAGIVVIGLVVIGVIAGIILHARYMRNKRRPGELSPGYSVQPDERTYKGYRNGERP